MAHLQTERLNLRPFTVARVGDDDRHALVEIEADCFTDNPASAHVLQTLGFKPVGEGLANSAARVDAHPIILYRLRREDYES